VDQAILKFNKAHNANKLIRKYCAKLLSLNIVFLQSLDVRNPKCKSQKIYPEALKMALHYPKHLTSYNT
jgi:hypothetical protein